MKNAIKHSKKGILMVTLFATLLSFANEASLFAIKNDARRTSLTLNNVKAGNLLSIKDDNGVTLYNELIHKTGTYTKGFDLTALPDGNYFFELDGVKEIKTIPFLVISNEVIFDNTNETSIFKPVTELDENLLLISKSSNNLDPLKIDLYYSGDSGNYELINSESIKDSKFIKRIYRLSDDKKGNYIIVYHTSGKKFTKHISF